MSDVKSDYLKLKQEIYKEIHDLDISQNIKIPKIIIDEVIENIENNKSNILLTIDHLREALYLISDLFYAINDQNSLTKITSYYVDFNWKNDLLQPWKTDDNPLNINEINSIISQYLSKPWFSSPTFEWYIINSYLRYCVNVDRKHYIYKLNGSIRALAAYATTPQGYYFIFFCLKCLNFIFEYVLPALIILYTFNKNWFIAALFLTMIFVFNRFLTFFNYFRCRKIKKENLRTLLKLNSLKIYVSSKSWSPSRVIKKIEEIDDIINIQELTPLVGKMIKRDPDIFSKK